MYDTPAELLEAIAAGEDTFPEMKLAKVDGRKIVFDSEGQAQGPSAVYPSREYDA